MFPRGSVILSIMTRCVLLDGNCWTRQDVAQLEARCAELAAAAARNEKAAKVAAAATADATQQRKRC